MARSLLRQLEQIRRAATYDDAVALANDPTVAEPTVSGSLEQDTNVLRTIIKQIKGGTGTNWYDAPEKYFDPTDTDGSNTPNKDITLDNIKGNTLDAKTIIVAVSDDDSGNGYPVTSTSSGVLLTPITQDYADENDRTGLPIFYSETNTGSYYDEGGADNVCRIDVINSETDTEFVDGSGNVVYAKFHDGADHPLGTGENTDAYAKFYADDTAIDLSTVSGVSNVYFVYPQRKLLSSMEEHEWLRTDFISSWEGDIELIEDIQNLWSYTGSSNNIDSTAGTWGNATADYLLSADPSNLKDAVDAINTGIGSRQYPENYITSGDLITTSLGELDAAIAALASNVEAGVGEKFVEVADAITKNTSHDISSVVTSYTPHAVAGREGMNMDVYVDGQLLAADTGAAGAEADRDYAEVDGTHIMFRFDIQAGRNITYIVRQ